MVQFDVIYFETRAGRQPIVDFLDGLDPLARAKCLARVSQLAAGMFLQGSKYSSRVRGDIWELRVRHANQQYRLLYALEAGTVYILIAIHKKTDKLDLLDIEQAETNLRELRVREGRAR